jgi:hypothetical protein
MVVLHYLEEELVSSHKTRERVERAPFGFSKTFFRKRANVGPPPQASSPSYST